ncbi:hypothetical protein H7J88_14385 [Mycolicibacterium flavescens]|uniref:Uncharacterized protein n=1 Tax=Mycolicibacterium flavescens TaxID=1776 RepID=A0A1E3REL9_MYCFV|nr:hypothetical protein [Mycolicibacterium flavescens]MCV7280834.1 hypothetical protein [Mycolicibacterium flavescens]ODQ88335.1 hypothetical protein BHQ18_19515 [Mycolicibacterium flavescens]
MNVMRRSGKWLAVLTAMAVLNGCQLFDFGRPNLPPSGDPAAVVDRVSGPDGQRFLLEITSASWEDNGRRAGELFAWIPRGAQSDDPATSARAAETAHAIASFLADDRDQIADSPDNPALWRSFTDSLIPYLGAMVGDDRGIAGFAPLDGLESPMRRTASLFAAMTKDSEANRAWVDAADAKALEYEQAFAKAAVAEPLLADRGVAQRDLLRAARLRSLVATGDHLTNPESPTPISTAGEIEIKYQVAALTARDDDPHINEEFFRDGRLLPLSDIPDSYRSIYDSQLTVYLTPWPRIREAVAQFGRTYNRIANGQ